MLVDPTGIPALRVFEVRGFPDERGVLLQSWSRTDLEARGVPSDFRQAIQTRSRRGIMRGLHFQREGPRGADPGAVAR
jgi:dTDP-4-dehydrorhamnose 3,5-epimerase